MRVGNRVNDFDTSSCCHPRCRSDFNRNDFQLYGVIRKKIVSFER